MKEKNKYFESIDDNSFNREEGNNTILTKIDHITRGQKPYLKRMLQVMLDQSPENAKSICDFIVAEQNEINIQESTAEWHIKVLYQIQRFLDFKDFNSITRDEILNYLNSLRKTAEEDPTHKSKQK